MIIPITVPMSVASSRTVIPMGISSSNQTISMSVEAGYISSRNYEDLSNKPRIEGVTLEGDKSFADLTLISLTNAEIEQLLTL